MSGPIVFIGTYRIPAGIDDEFAAAGEDMTEFVRSTLPEVLAFNTYVSADGREGTTIHSHVSADSFDRFLVAAAPRIARGSEMLDVTRVEFFGSPNADTLSQMRAGGPYELSVKTWVRGFSRR